MEVSFELKYESRYGLEDHEQNGVKSELQATNNSHQKQRPASEMVLTSVPSHDFINKKVK